MSNEYFGTRWTFYFGYCSLEEEQFRAHRSKRGEEIFWYVTSGFRLISDRALIWRVSILWRKGKRRIYIYIYNGIIQSVVDTRLQRNCRPSVTSWPRWKERGKENGTFVVRYYICFSPNVSWIMQRHHRPLCVYIYKTIAMRCLAAWKIENSLFSKRNEWITNIQLQ